MEAVDSSANSSLVNSDPGADPLVGTVFDGTYEIISQIGKGGMGSVYKAYHRHLDRIVAVKVLRGYASRGQTLVQRFRQEARALSMLSHKNIVYCHAFGFHEDSCFLALDFVDGITLQDEIIQHGTLTPERFRRVFSQVLSALEHAHKNGIVHRDLKPENIMLISEGEGEHLVKMVDFGIAKLLDADNPGGPGQQQLTRTGAFMGSPLYMSPEQCRGAVADHTTDIYSLGCVMYFAVTGKSPFEDTGILEIIRQHLNEEAPPLPAAVPGAISNLIATAMEKQPADRFATATEMKSALESLDATAPTSRLQRKRNPSPILRRIRQHKPAVIAAATIGLVAVGITGFYAWQNYQRSELRAACDQASLKHAQLINQHRRQGAATLRPIFLAQDREVFASTDELLRNRIVYANALLDESAATLDKGPAIEQASNVSKAIDSDIRLQHDATDTYPVLSPATISGIIQLGGRYADLNQNAAATTCFLLATAALQQRSTCSGPFGFDGLAEAEKLVEVVERAKKLQGDQSCLSIELIPKETQLLNRPRAYKFAALQAMKKGEQAKAKDYAGKSYRYISEITSDSVCPISQDAKGRDLTEIAMVLQSLRMDKEALDLLQKAAASCHLMSKKDSGPTAAAAGYLLTLVGARNGAPKEQLYKTLDASIEAAREHETNAIPIALLGVDVATTFGDTQALKKYQSLVLNSGPSRMPDGFPMYYQLESQLQLGKLLLKIGKTAEAEESFQRFLSEPRKQLTITQEARPYIELAFKIGDVYHQANMPEQARRYWHDAITTVRPFIESESTDPAARKRSAASAVKTLAAISARELINHDFKGAKSSATLGLQLSSTGGEPYFVGLLHLHRASAELNLAEFKEALSDAEQACAQFDQLPKNSDAAGKPLATALLYIGVAHARQDQCAQSEQPLRRSLQVWQTQLKADPNSEPVKAQVKNCMNELTEVLRRLNKSAGADQLEKPGAG